MKAKSILNYLSVLTLTFVFLQTPAWSFSGNLSYTNGRVQEITEDRIMVSGKTYILDANARVLIHTKKDGAFYESFGRKSDVQHGDSVYIRTAGGKVMEIIVERWKK